MIQNLTEMIRKNEYFLTRELVTGIREMPEARHYRNIVDDTLYDRVHHVLYHVYKRLPYWLHHNTSKNTVFSFYSELGRQRYGENIPLQEMIQVLFFIKRGIYRCISERRTLDNGFTLDHIAEFFSLVNLFFDRMAQAVISGYLEAMTVTGGAEKNRIQ
jgi:hypothetical protein